MKMYLILFIALSLVTCSKDEPEILSIGSWKQLKNYPGEGRSGIAFSLLGKGYWGMGNSATGYMRDFWMYDPSADSWEQKKDFPADLPLEAAVVINDKSYVITYSGGLYEYDPVADSWKYLSSFPGGVCPGLTAFALGGDAFFGTGNIMDADNNFTPSKIFWKYEPSKNKWTQLDDYPGAGRVEAVSFVIGEKAYVGLGHGGTAPPIYTDIWSYNATTSKWSQMVDFPNSGSLTGILFSSATKGYIGFPENNSTHHGQVYEYDPVGNSWRKVREFPRGSSLGTSSFTLNDRMFVVGGWWSEYSSEVWEFIP